MTYRQTSNKAKLLVTQMIGAAPTTSSFSTEHLALMIWAKATARGDEKHLSFGT